MGQLKITLPDGSVRDVERGTRVADIAASISLRLAKSALAGLVNGQPVDLSHALDADASVRVVTPDSPVSAKVTLGTRLSDRVFVSYSQNLGATEDQQVAVRYYLLDYLSLWGQQMRQGIYSLDLVFRQTFR